VPFLPAHRPRADARFWHACAAFQADTLVVQSLERTDSPPQPVGPCGLAAPCSLPEAFIAWLQIEGDVLAALHSRTAKRLQAQARTFAREQIRGSRHPARAPEESMSALDRRRLARFYAALPILRSDARVFEVDTQSLLRALDLPHTGLSGDAPDAVARRARVLDALRDGALGFAVALDARDLAVASRPALEAVVAACMAAWVDRHDAQKPADARVWIPLP